MINPKNVLVTTASGFDGYTVKRHIKPVSAHVVAGTNIFSDFFASFSDVFGGRSSSYQKQLTSLYNEAIDRLKISAYEIGANAIVGLHVDMDEISGKGKSMFMVTAIGTAIVVEFPTENSSDLNGSKLENVSVEKVKALQKKRELVAQAESGSLILNDSEWEFIIDNQLYEIYGFLLDKFKLVIKNDSINQEATSQFYTRLLSYLDFLPESLKEDLLYKSVVALDNGALLEKIFDLIRDLNVLKFERVAEIISLSDFTKQKRSLRLLTFHKPFYNRNDVTLLQELIGKIEHTFPERAARSFKKQLLSSKEKEVWICECKSTIEIGKYCGTCKTDIFGFTANEIPPADAIQNIKNRISLIISYLDV